MKSFTHMNTARNSAYALVVVLLFALTLSPALAATTEDGATDWGTVRQQRIYQYHQQSSEMAQKIAALPSTANPVVMMPVLFGVGVKDISPNFGDPRSGGRTHEGEDIMAVKGTPIVSPTPAVVLRTVVGASEGNAVYTANPGGETFVYMHLDRFGEGVVAGTVLATGSLIGYVGNTGNATGGAAHLHFEIHNSSGTPTDPFPRLTGEFPLADKIADLATILTQTSDSKALAEFLVINFRGTFVAGLAANIALPLSITDALATIPATSPTTPPVVTLPAGDLDIGSSGTAVITLQTYLIQQAKGSAAARLAGAGATGYFGAITKAALLEFQVAVGISPASGYYGPETRAFIAAHGATPTPPTTPPATPPATGGTTLSRNLYQGISGEDVRTLQKILNANGYTVATTGAGSSGNETTYFGAATAAAVKRFQTAKGITPVAGYVGPITRAALNSLAVL